jgi:hypothetical protein
VLRSISTALTSTAVVLKAAGMGPGVNLRFPGDLGSINFGGQQGGGWATGNGLDSHLGKGSQVVYKTFHSLKGANSP